MRYMNWDVLLFPGAEEEEKIPLQEFRTICEVVQDATSTFTRENYFSTVARPLPIVSCFVPSLSPGLPFRISIYSWNAPTVTNATKTVVNDEQLVVFEAKVFIDGVFVAGLVFEKGSNWPQLIETSSHDSQGKTGQLYFPIFHTALLEQTWANPAQALGRIKLVIAEGTCAAPNSGFEKIRDVIAFAFQHAPLPILEETGIAWPNNGMWYQATPQFDNPLSPRKNKAIDPDSHAHSPRRRLGQTESLMTPISTSAHRTLTNPFDEQENAQSMVPPSFSQWQKDYQKAISHSVEITMRDRSVVSSSDHDQSMPDYSRPLSPASASLRSLQMTDHSRPPSFTSALTHAMPEGVLAPSTSSRAESRHSSDWEVALSTTGPIPVPVVREVNEPKVASPQLDAVREESASSYFEDVMASYTPGRLVSSGTSAPENTQVSCAGHTPPAKTRPSAAKEARESSYTGKPRIASITSREAPPLPKSSAPGSNGNFGAPNRLATSVQMEYLSSKSFDPHQVMQYAPSSDIKSRKEGRSAKSEPDFRQQLILQTERIPSISQQLMPVGQSQDTYARHGWRHASNNENVELGLPSEQQRNLFHTSPHDYETAGADSQQETGSPGGKPKRRRTSRPLLREASTNSMSNENSIFGKAMGIDEKTSSPVKHNDIDDLTPEGVVSRSALAELDENLV